MSEYYIIDPQTYDDQFWWKKDDIEFWKKIILPGSKVLELGAGTGRLGLPLVMSSIDYTGLELSDSYVNFANVKFSNSSPLIQGDMRNFTLDIQYDVIFIGFNSLLHLLSEDDLIQCLHSIKAHMHNHTRIYIDIFVPKTSFLYRSDLSPFFVMEFFDSQKKYLSVIEESLSYNNLDEIISVKWQYKQKGTSHIYHTFNFQMKAYYPDTMNRILIDVGLKITNLWGSYEQEKFAENSDLQIYEIVLF